MKLPGGFRKSERGFSYVEILVSALLMSIGLMGLLNTWLFSFRISMNTDDSAIAYSLGRFSLERVKMTGFVASEEGTTNSYYSGNEVATTAGSATCRYKVTRTLTSSAVTAGTIGVSGAVPADNALRTLVVTVRMYSTNAILYSTTTYLARAGV
jgi:Tfp pilus assembly protein PilV